MTSAGVPHPKLPKPLPFEKLPQQDSHDVCLIFKATRSKQENQITKEETLADKIFRLFRKPVIAAVTDSLGCIIAEEMKAMPMFRSKQTLKAQILLDLGEKDSFEEFYIYLTDTKESLHKWIKFYTESRIKKLSKEKLEEVTVAMIEGANGVTITEWLKQVHKWLGSFVTFDDKEFKQMGVCNFYFEVKKGLSNLRQSLFEDLSPFFQIDSWSKCPYNLFDTMLGCCERCPFCNEQCKLTTNHGCKHSVELHRPLCLRGYTDTSNNEMTLHVCPSRVASTSNFKNCNTGGELHPYKNYQIIYPEWDITPDASCQPSSHWQWFVARYSAQIVKRLKAKETKIPDSWTRLTWEEVKNDLKTKYNL